MTTSKITYLGDLRTKSIHLQSGSELINDAPVDNHGKGEAFSPTDLVANSLATCMLTTMGIKADNMGISIVGSEAEVIKTMRSEPRQISKIEVTLRMKGTGFDMKVKNILERTAMTCPVFLSLHPEIEKIVNFNWE